MAISKYRSEVVMKKKTNKSAKIRALIDEGLDDHQIRRRLKVSSQLVYLVRRNYINGKSQNEMLKKHPIVKDLMAAMRALERALREVPRMDQ